MYLLKIIENKNIENNKFIKFRPGDIISVDFISNLNKNKIQNFTGIVIYIKNKGINTSFLIKKNSKNNNIEKNFKLFSPSIKSIKIKYKNRFKKSKLYYLRKFKNNFLGLKKK